MFPSARCNYRNQHGPKNWPMLALSLVALSTLCNAIAIHPHASAVIKVMIVGNSITAGYEADYTWRYRIWEWFKTNDVPVEFVGPYRGTAPPDIAEPLSQPPPQSTLNPNLTSPSSWDPPKTNGRYAADVSPDFNGAHFSIWGFQTAQAKDRIREMTARYQPDLILVELGFNDLGWFVNGPEGTLADMKTLVDSARAGRGRQSQLKFAIANVPQRTFITGRDDLPVNTERYNAMLAAACDEWSTPRSPVKLVRFRETYACETDGCPAGHDGLHPNALGEYQIAKAYSMTLLEVYGLGHSILEIPDEIPPRPCPAPENFRLTAVASGVVAMWDHAFGAYGYFAYHRTVGGGPDWEGTNWFLSKNRSDYLGLPPGVELEVKVRADCGSGILSGFTDVRRARTGGTRDEDGPNDQKERIVDSFLRYMIRIFFTGSLSLVFPRWAMTWVCYALQAKDTLACLVG